MGVLDIFSQTRTLQKRKEAGLHIINELQRFRLLLCCIYCATGTSLVYTFELFTPEFTSQFGLSAGDLSTVSTVSVVFHYFVVPYVVVIRKMGPTLLLIFTAITGFVGTLGMALIFQNKVSHSLAVICIFYAIMNTCVGLFDAATVTTAQYTFPRNRGPALSLVKVMTGLGSSVFASVYHNLFTNSIVDFLYFVLAFAIVVAGVSIFVVVMPPYEVNWWRARGKSQEEIETLQSLSAVYYTKSIPMRRLGAGYVVGITLVVFFAITSPVVAYMDVPRSANYAIGALTIIFLLGFCVMILPIKWLGGMDEPSPLVLQRLATQQQRQHEEEEQRAEEKRRQQHPEPIAEEMHDAGVKPGVTEAGMEVEEEEEDENKEGKEKKEEKKENERRLAAAVPEEAEVDDANQYAEYTEHFESSYTDPRYPQNFWQQLRRPDVYLLYLGLILQGAIGVIVMYNSSTIYVARTGEGRSAGLSALYTAFMGVGSAVGRICVGLYEACVQRQKEGHRRFLTTLILPIPPLIGIIGGILILVLPGQALLLPYILVYLKEGAFYSTCAIVLPSIFSTHSEVYYILSSATTVVAVICFNRFLFGYIVDKEHDKLNYAKGESCSQTKCILTPLIVATVLSAVSAVLLLIVHLRYTRFVRRTERERTEKRLRSQQEEEEGLQQQRGGSHKESSSNRRHPSARHFEEEEVDVYSPTLKEAIASPVVGVSESSVKETEENEVGAFPNS